MTAVTAPCPGRRVGEWGDDWHGTWTGEDRRRQRAGAQLYFGGMGGRNGKWHRAGTDGLRGALYGLDRSGGLVRRGIGGEPGSQPRSARTKRRVHHLPRASLRLGRRRFP